MVQELQKYLFPTLLRENSHEYSLSTSRKSLLLLTATLLSNLLHPREMMSMNRAISNLKTRNGQEWLGEDEFPFSMSYFPEHKSLTQN